MASLEALCVRETEGKITPALLKRLRGLQAEMIAARAGGNTARAVAADSEFHRLLWEASGLRQVVQVLQNVWDRGEYYRVIMHARRGGFAAESLAEHEEVLKALEAGDTPGRPGPSRPTGCGPWSDWPRRRDASDNHPKETRRAR